jgi:hypothetical protein
MIQAEKMSEIFLRLQRAHVTLPADSRVSQVCGDELEHEKRWRNALHGEKHNSSFIHMSLICRSLIALLGMMHYAREELRRVVDSSNNTGNMKNIYA